MLKLGIAVFEGLSARWARAALLVAGIAFPSLGACAWFAHLAPVQPPTASRGAITPWDYETGADFLFASIRGPEGAFGQYCEVAAGACMWMLVLRSGRCTIGESFPVLVNTEAAASHQVMLCIGSRPERGAVFAFVDFDRMDESVRGARRIAIAVPGEGDGIGIARFALDGAASAIERMRDLLRDSAATPPRVADVVP